MKNVLEMDSLYQIIGILRSCNVIKHEFPRYLQFYLDIAYSSAGPSAHDFCRTPRLIKIPNALVDGATNT